MTPGEVRTLSAARREALVIHATTPAVKVRMTRHYEGPHRELYSAATAEARTIAGLTPSARLLPRTGTSPGASDLTAPANTTPHSTTRGGRIS